MGQSEGLSFGRCGVKMDDSLTSLWFLLADVAYEIFTEEVIPQRFMDQACAVLSADVMAVAPVVRLTRLPHPTGKEGVINVSVGETGSGWQRC